MKASRPLLAALLLVGCVQQNAPPPVVRVPSLQRVPVSVPPPPPTYTDAQRKEMVKACQGDTRKVTRAFKLTKADSAKFIDTTCICSWDLMASRGIEAFTADDWRGCVTKARVEHNVLHRDANIAACTANLVKLSKKLHWPTPVAGQIGRDACSCDVDLSMANDRDSTPAEWEGCLQSAINRGAPPKTQVAQAPQQPLVLPYGAYPVRGRGESDDEAYERGREDGYNDEAPRGHNAAYREGYEDGQDEDSNGNLPGESGYQEE